jgi:hypothetical protein
MSAHKAKQVVLRTAASDRGYRCKASSTVGFVLVRLACCVVMPFEPIPIARKQRSIRRLPLLRRLLFSFRAAVGASWRAATLPNPSHSELLFVG